MNVSHAEVQYEAIRDTIKTGHLFFTASPAFFSRVIRLFTRCTISHVGIFLWLGGRLFVVEAMEGKGVVMSLASNRLTDFWLGSTASHRTEENIIESALQQLGEDYDMLGALSSLFVDTKSKQKFCSEFVSYVLELNFSHLKRGITPADVASKCGKLIKVSI